MNLGDNRAAVGLYDRAIEILERLVNVEGRRELANDLATLYMNKANAVGTWETTGPRWVCMTGRSRFSSGWSMSRVGANWPTTWQRLYMNKAIAVGDLGDNRAAVGFV